MRRTHSRLNMLKLAALPLVGLFVAAGLVAWALWSPLGGSPTAAQATGPHLSVNKECSLSEGVFTFTFTLTNDGDTPLIRWKVEDTTLGRNIGWEFPETLAVDQTETVTLTKVRLPSDGLCNWATFSYRTESWTVVKALPECCVTPTPPRGSVHLTKVFGVGPLTKPTLVCFRLDEQVGGFVPSPDPPEGAEQCKVPDAAGQATFSWTNLDLPDVYRVWETLVECERQVDGIIFESPCTAYAAGPIPPELLIAEFELTEAHPTQNITLENPSLPGSKRITKQNADGRLWTGPDVTFHICRGSVTTCDPTSATFEGSVVIPGDGNPVEVPEPEGTYTVCEVPPPNFTVEPSKCQTKNVLAAMTTNFVFKNIPPGGEGCTPGYWKNHLDAWGPTGLSPGDDFDTTFGVDLFDPDITLEEAVNAKGGGVKKLARHGTAALLGAAHPGVAYPFTVAEVIAAVQAGDAGALAKANELGCPLNGGRGHRGGTGR